jgi:hypothetical protein
MAVGRQALALRFSSVAIQLGFRKAAFEKGPRIDTWRGMRLEVDEVIVTEDMVEADLEEVRGRGVARDVAAELGVGAVNCGWCASAIEFL